MNWTAILALLTPPAQTNSAVNAFVAVAVTELAVFGVLLWLALLNADNSRRDAKDAIKRAEYAESMKYVANAQASENRQEADHWKRLHDSLLKRQSRTGQRAGETDHAE